MHIASHRFLILMTALIVPLAGCGGGDSSVTAPKVDAGAVEVDTGVSEVSDNTDTTESSDAAITDSGATDSGATDSDATDSGTTDSGTTDSGSGDTKTADAPVYCPGQDGCACKTNSECGSGICMDTHEGKQCAQKCVDSCPGGYACKDIGDGAPLFYCVSTQLTLCSPCQFHSDCQVNGVASLCVDYGADGKFCGAPCATDSECPSDYACATLKDASGKDVKQCKRKEVAGKPQVCACSDWAKAKGLETECVSKSDAGTCKAKRTCGAKGLSACTAKTPVSEVCNTVDDDCDGKTDNLPTDFACTIKAFTNAGSKSKCLADGDCKVSGEACDTAASQCKVLIGACPGKAACDASGALLCTGAAVPKPEVCNGIDDDCDGQADEGFTWDGGAAGKLSVGAACGVGACSGGKVVCDGATKATCDGLSKADKESCNGVDNDCNGKTDDNACEDNNACTTDICDAAAKICSYKVTVDCDDKNSCTDDVCDTTTAKCSSTPRTGSCDDNNACTGGDKCGEHPVSGTHTCLPGTGKPTCDDNNPCTDDICDTQKGCQSKANSGSQPCYTGATGTKGKGTCKAGTSYCKDGKLQGACTGEVTPAAKELCDGQDHTCDGVKDEGCAPKGVKVTFASARIAGKSGKLDVQMLVGQSGPAGQTSSAKYNLRYGFLAWLQALTK